jgi:hypothetical protein
VLSFVLTSTSAPMVALRALELLPLSHQMTPATPSSSSMATIGKAACSRSARIALQVPDLDSVAGVALVVVVEALLEALGPAAVVLEAAVASVVALVAAVASVAGMEVPLEVVSMLEPLLLLPTPLQILPLPAQKEARSFMSAT